jgi:hypothetical protein
MDSKIHVQLEGSGYNVWLVFITPETYNRLKENAENDFPKSAFDIVEEEKVAGHERFICCGIDSHSGFKGKITYKKQEILINGAIHTEPEYSIVEVAADQGLSNIENLIECRFEDEGRLGDGELLPKNLYAVVDITQFDYCKLIAHIDAEDKRLDIRNFRLLTTELDSFNEYAEATYNLGLLKGMERDIWGISYNEKEYEFQQEIMSGTKEFFLLRHNNGKWELDPNSNGYLFQ